MKRMNKNVNLWIQRIVAVLMVVISTIISIVFADGDMTFVVFLLIFAIPMFFSKKIWLVL